MDKCSFLVPVTYIFIKKSIIIVCYIFRAFSICANESQALYNKTTAQKAYVSSWSSGRHSALGSEGPEFESLFHQVDVESMEKALYMHFLPKLWCKMGTQL